MKKLSIVLLLSLCSFLSKGQSVTAPDSKSFLQSTAAQDASGFALSDFSATATLLASISLVNPPSGTTFTLNTSTGLTAASGFTLSGNKTRLVVTGTMADINTALASLKINTGSIKGNVALSVAATVNPTGYFYNGVNGHFYRPIATGNTYTGARAAALNTTFKGQTGYLVTITSSDEDAFIYNNVPQSQIWFALTDEGVEGQWRIDAGPEKGTLIKTSNGQTAGNITGQYNNWAGGEPNNSGNEDYAVTKWNGTQWNDLPNNFNCPYVIEYGTWTNPDDAIFTEFYTNSVTHTNGEVLSARFNLNFGSAVDETKFSAKAYTYINSTWNTVNSSTRAISGLGKVDMTNDLDTGKMPDNGHRGTISGGGVEWSYCEPGTLNSGANSRLLIDMRKVGNIDPTSINSIKILDVYDGPISYISHDGTWAQYNVPSNLVNVTNGTSTNNQYIRNSGYGGWAFACDITFVQPLIYKQHGIEIVANNQTELNTLYNNIVTVTDVYLAFRELSNGGLFGNESGNEFTSGIQFMNADVNDDGVFNETDTYKLLQHLTGAQSLTQFSTLTYLMKVINKSDYDAVTKSNWNTPRTGTAFSNLTRNLYPFSLNTGVLNNTYNLNITWKGDINLSHSAAQVAGTTASNSISTMSLRSNSISNDVQASIITELSSGKLYAYINFNPMQQEVVGTQFQLNYDNSVLKFESVEFKTKGSPMNYGTNKTTFVNIGSLISNGNSTLDNTTEYKVTFTPLRSITNGLGLIGIGSTDAVNRAGVQLKVKVN
jgi:hypothetical protein